MSVAQATLLPTGKGWWSASLKVRRLSDRWRLLCTLRDAGAPTVVGLVVALIAENAAPAANTASLAALIGRFSGSHGASLFSATLPVLGVYAGSLIIGQLAAAATAPLTAVAASRVDGQHRTRVSQLCASTQLIDKVERSKAQALIREAMVDRSRGYDSTPSDGAMALLRSVAAIIGAAAMCVVIAEYSWWLIAFVLLPAMINRAVRRRQNEGVVKLWMFATQAELHTDVWRRASTSPSDGKDIRIFGFGQWMVERMQESILEANVPLWTYISRNMRRIWLPIVVIVCGLAPAYVIVSVSGAHGHTTVAAATAVLTGGWALCQVLAPDDDQYRVVGALRTLNAFEELRELLAEESPPSSAQGFGASSAAPPRIKFEQVSFRYPGSERLVLDALDLEVTPGELLAVVGLNGAGKSTLIKLLTGLYKPVSGRITLDGADLAGLDRAAWRAQTAVVFQDFVRYHLSAAENVALGYRWDAVDMRSLEEAGRETGLENVVRGLPSGWDTPLSRARAGGVDLSGGQWQQVVLARALYAVRRGARLLVLDEPTAHLDVRAEFEAFRTLAEHRGETSVVLISHRLSTVRQADRIVLLDSGRIVESGTHDELIACGGQYANLFATQASRFRQGYDDRAEEEWSG